MERYVPSVSDTRRPAAFDPRGDGVFPLMALDRDLAAALAYSRFATQALAAHPEDAEWLVLHLEAPAGVSDAASSAIGAVKAVCLASAEVRHAVAIGFQSERAARHARAAGR